MQMEGCFYHGCEADWGAVGCRTGAKEMKNPGGVVEGEGGGCVGGWQSGSSGFTKML